MKTLKNIETKTLTRINEMFEMGLITPMEKANMTINAKRDTRFAIGLTK